MSSPFKKLSFTSSHRMVGTVIALSLCAVATAIYLSPAAHKSPSPVSASATSPVEDPAAKAAREAAAKAAAMAKWKGTGSKPSATHPATPTTSPATGSPTLGSITSPGTSFATAAPTVTDAVLHTDGGASASATPSASRTATTQIKHCNNFKWQQDAQAAYLANLSDPGALDGAIGPNNGDGIACNNLPVDPSRPASTPVDAYVPVKPTAAAKAALVAPTAKYYGVFANGLPRDTSLFDSISTAAVKAPSSVSWFSGFDSDYQSDAVTTAWSRGALPIITWMSVAMNASSGHDSSEYTLSKIVSGSVDPYLYKFAGDVVRTNLPVVLRFDHEMNGNSYPWSAGMYKNTPALYVAAWQHIWNLFQSVGANSDVIWLWAPTRIDTLKPHATTGNGVGQTDLAEDYPGDGYVDWVGASIYLRVVATGPTYAATFGKTITALEALTTKPIFVAETGAIETDLSTGLDVAALKATWTANALAGFLADPRIIGFSWFNNVGTSLINGVPTKNDWRFTSSTQAQTAFQTAVSDSRFLTGVAPDGL
ncbi:Glycosyl hydrolase family 26 [Frankineae bacterium MT45]|nr:Glycosyl hydrolase family 26 [Frankineae bacterium MT45]